MESAARDDPESALRPLRNVAGARENLRIGSLNDAENRRGVIQVAAAVETTLRRLLRDFPGASLQVRLHAVDDLRVDEVLAELRQHDQISIELAAAVHDLLEIRQRLREGAQLLSHDATLAYHVADRLEHEAANPPSPTTQAAPAGIPGGVELSASLDDPFPRSPVAAFRTRRGGMSWGGDNVRWYVALTAAFLVFSVVGLWWALQKRADVLEEGITRFRSGSYAEAAVLFQRYAETHPEDPTPRLYLARIHRRQAQPELAVAQLDTALAAAPDDADVYVELGFLLLDTGDAAGAVQRFRSALLLDPRSESAWLGLVSALRLDGREQAAADVLKTAPPDIRERIEAGVR